MLTADSLSSWYNLKLGAEATAQRYSLGYQAQPDAPAYATGFREARPTLFAESDLSLAPRLTARAGVRAEYSGLLGQLNAAPRLALAGLAVTVSTSSWLPEGLRVVLPEEGLPPLPDFGISLLTATRPRQPVTDALARYITDTFRQETSRAKPARAA